MGAGKYFQLNFQFPPVKKEGFEISNNVQLVYHVKYV